jgi:uncharacterized protein (DUF305 family)
MLKQLLLVISVLLLTASSAFATGPGEGRAGRAERRFLEGMIDHHQMALDMANDCLAKAASETVLTQCQVIIDAQTGEIEQMREWLRSWYNVEYTPVPMLSDDGMSGMNMGEAATDPAMAMGMMAGLNQLEGRDYEIAWLEAMIDHHDDAIHMAERILRHPAHEAVSQLATNIIRDQSNEIAGMEILLVELAGT